MGIEARPALCGDTVLLVLAAGCGRKGHFHKTVRKKLRESSLEITRAGGVSERLQQCKGRLRFTAARSQQSLSGFRQ